MMESRFKLTPFKDIKTEVVNWLWYPYIPLGMLTVFGGDAGIGKTFQTTYLASVVSKGEKFPFSDINAPKGKVIIQNAEDLQGATRKKRLETFDADMNNIYVIELKEGREEEMDLLLKDINDLDMLFDELNPKLVIFDPITNFLGDLDMNSATKIRQTLKPMIKLAEKYNCAIVFVAHRNKGIQGGNQLHRLSGSVDIGAIARSVVSIGINPNNKSEKLFIHTKHNLSEQGKTLAFVTNEEDGITWLGTREYIQDDETSNEEIKPKIIPRDIAKNFIINYLEVNGKSKYEDIVISANEQGISEKTLRRARDELKEEEIIDKEYADGKTIYWYLIEVCPNAHP